MDMVVLAVLIILVAVVDQDPGLDPNTQVVPQQDIMVQIVVDTVDHQVDILEVAMGLVVDIHLVREEQVSIPQVDHRIVIQHQGLDIHQDQARTISLLVGHRVILLKGVDHQVVIPTLDHSQVHQVRLVDLQLAVLQVPHQYRRPSLVLLPLDLILTLLHPQLMVPHHLLPHQVPHLHHLPLVLIH